MAHHGTRKIRDHLRRANPRQAPHAQPENGWLKTVVITGNSSMMEGIF
jgi:hypothetical protein